MPAVRLASREDIAAIIDAFRTSVRQIASRDYTPAQVMMYVHPAFQRRGVASALLEQVESRG